ncbi:hypothetical protein [Streptomyces misionensis]|uniref:hypothetical protein n=1 Tax=Streptomyces misionensis TaxID=67331 RepID=UPI0033AE5AA2
MPRWLTKPLDGGNRPRKRQLVLAIRPLLAMLRTQDPAKSDGTPPTQAEVAKRLHSNATSLSRFVSLDPRVPPRFFIEALHEAACADAGANGGEVGITLDALQDLRDRADAETRGCPRCVELSDRIDSLTQQLNRPCPACVAYQEEQKAYQKEQEVRTAQVAALTAQAAALRKEAAGLRAEVRTKETAVAGLQARLAMTHASRPPLPVPRRQGDRQRSKKDMAVARQLAAQAQELDSAGKQDEALALLQRGTTELLSPAETALVIVELRQRKRDHLVDNLIHVYGRDQEDRPVMAVAAELHEEGAADDAGAVLRAALR